VPTLPHEVIVDDVVYPTIFLTYGWSLGLLSAMVSCLQSGLRVLCQKFCNVVVEEGKEGNVVIGSDGEPKMKTLNPHAELPYTYFIAWYIMHYPSLM